MKSMQAYTTVNQRVLRCQSRLREWNHLTAKGGKSWLEIAVFLRDLNDVMCQACKKMCGYLDQLVCTAVAVTPARKASRQDPSSTCPISSLSPTSQKKRKYNLMHEQVEDRKRLQKYEHTEVTLDDDQNDELSHVVHTINAKSPGREILSQIFEKAENEGKGQIVREIWENELRLQFNKDKARNGHYPIAYIPPLCSAFSLTHTHSFFLSR